MSSLDTVIRRAIRDHRTRHPALKTRVVVARLQAQGWANADRWKLDDIENGTRHLTVEEFLHLAFALDIAPADLLVGTPSGARLDDSPDADFIQVCGVQVTPARLHRWWVGLSPLVPPTSGGRPLRESHFYATRPWAVRPRWFHERCVNDLVAAVDRLVDAYGSRRGQAVGAARKRLLDQVERSVAEMRSVMRDEAANPERHGL